VNWDFTLKNVSRVLKVLLRSSRMKNYEQTGDLNALKIALDGNVTLGEMLKQVEEFYDHSYAMILSLLSR